MPFSARGVSQGRQVSSSASSTHSGHSQKVAPGASHYLHQHMHQDNYSRDPSSSNMCGKTIHGENGVCNDQGKSSGKRKRHIYDTRSIRRYSAAGSSSNTHLHDKQSNESHHAKLEYPQDYGNTRNITSRTVVKVKTNQAKTHLSNSGHAPSSRSTDQSSSRDFSGRSSNKPMRGSLLSPSAGRDSTLTKHPNGSLEIGEGYNDTSNMNHIADNVTRNLNQSVGGVPSDYSQRSTSTLGVSSSNFCPRYVAGSDEAREMVAESNSSRCSQLLYKLRLCNDERIRRNHMSSDERCRAQEGLVIRDYSSYQGSRSIVDQHMDDMRLDTDNMSYEELLALGERIGSVSTGLSDDLISKILTESINCSSDIFEDDGTCIICLEEYKNMDDVGTLKVCGHYFHVGCIRKWLSMKNVCPICKAPAVDEGK